VEGKKPRRKRKAGGKGFRGSTFEKTTYIYSLVNQGAGALSRESRKADTVSAVFNHDRPETVPAQKDSTSKIGTAELRLLTWDLLEKVEGQLRIARETGGDKGAGWQDDFHASRRKEIAGNPQGRN